MEAKKTQTFAEKIISGIYDPSQKWKYDIWPLKLVVLFFIVFNFHQVNKYPLLRLDYITIAEALFLMYTLVFFVFLKNKRSFKVQIMSLFLDFLFIAFFDYQSLSVFGYSSRVYVLYIIIVIYCSYWFRGIFTIVFVTLVSAAYAAINYSTPDMKVFYTAEEKILKLWPVIGVFYLIALGIVLYKRYVVFVYPELKKRAEKLEQIKESTRNLLKDKIDGYIEVDEVGNVVDTNKLAWELLGYSEEEIRKINVRKLYGPGEASRIMKLLRHSPDGTIYNIKTWMESKEGEKIPILVTASFLYDRNLNLKREFKKGRRFPSIVYFRDTRAEDIFDSIAREITSITNERELLDKIVIIVARTVKSETCSVLIYNENIEMIEITISFGMHKQLKGQRGIESYTENEGLTGKVFSSGKTLNVSNIDVVNKQPKDISIKWKFANRFARYSRYGDLKHFLGTPLIIQGEVYGVIRVLNKYRSENELDAKGFTDKDQWLLERISRQVSILLEKVRDKERFYALSRVGMELNERLELSFEELLEVIVKQVVIGMKFKACYLRLLEEGNKLRIKACHGLKGDYNNERYALKIGQGISGKVAEIGKWMVIEDLIYEKNFKLKELLEKEKLKSMLAIPLKYRSRVIGVINCYTGRKHKFTEQEIQIMETFAVYASVAIQNKKRMDELMALSEIGRELSKPFQTEELLDIILQQAKAISGADSLCMKRYDERTGEISTIRSLNCVWHNKNRNYKFKLGEDKISKVVYTGEPIIIKNFDAEKEGLKNEPSIELLKKFKSRIIVPFKIYGKIFGALCLDSHRKNFFTEDDLLISNTFAIQAANAIRNTNFFNKLQAVTETFSKISELHINIDEVLKKIADTSAKVLDTDVLVLYRYDEKNKRIIWPPIYSGKLLYPQYMQREVDSSDAPLLFINRGQNHYTVDSKNDPFMTPPGQKPRKGIPARFLFRENIVSSAGIILKVANEIVGIMFINYRKPNEFNDDERQIIEIFASYIAIAIQNVMHFQAKEDADKKVLQAERLASLGKAAGFVAHNARSDLWAVQIYLNQIMKGISKKGITEFNPILESVQKNLKNVNTSIADLLDIAKKPELEKKQVSFNDAFQEKFKDFENEAKLYDLHFRVKLSNKLPAIPLDEKKMAQVFSNLFKNSLEATSEGGEIKVEVKTHDQTLIIFWENTGEHIPEDQHEKIFDIFYSQKRSWGLGLNYCKKIIEEHNGKIYVDAKFKKGTRFVIEIPF